MSDPTFYLVVSFCWTVFWVTYCSCRVYYYQKKLLDLSDSYRTLLGHYEELIEDYKGLLAASKQHSQEQRIKVSGEFSLN